MLQGLAGLTVKDWVVDAESRLITDQAAKLLEVHIALINIALADPAGTAFDVHQHSGQA